MTWCKRNRLRTEYFAACVLHTFALNIGAKAVTIHSGKPGHRADILEGVYDMDPDMVRGVEHIAKRKRTTSRAILTELLGPALRHWREARGIS